MHRSIHLALFCTGALLVLSAMALADDTQTLPTPGALFKLTYEDAEKAIGDALVQKGAGAKIVATINGKKGDNIFSYGTPIAVEVRGLTFDKSASRWTANLLALSGEEVLTATPVAGRFDEVVETPVLKRQVRSGEVIGENDIELHDYPLSRTRADTVGSADQLVGQSPIRTISAFRPIRTHEVSAPAVIKKNAIVQMSYSSPGMEITASGQALDDGAKGSLITVRNLVSKKIVRAIVESETTVKVSAGAMTQAVEARSTTEGDTHATN